MSYIDAFFDRDRDCIEIVEREKAGFAFPSQSLYLESLPNNIPEIFIPPKK